MNNMSARQTALQIVYKVNEDGAFSNVAMDKELSKNLLKDRRDVSLVTEIVNGTIKNRIYLDHVLQQFSKQKLEKLSPWVRNVLRISAYQILFLDKIPESAAVNEGVNLTKKYSHQGSVKFVNAVLRNIIRKKHELSFPEKEKNVSQYLSIKYSFPAWLTENFIKSYGEENTEKMFKYFNSVPPVWIRINNILTTPEEIENLFSEKEVKIERSKYVPEGYKVAEGNPAMNMDAYKKGLFSVQDITSMFAVDILDPLPEENIIDVCSAPGGKTAFIAERMNNKGNVKAIELYEHRIKIIEENCKRNQITIVDAETGDARDLHLKYREEFDKVLADVPCSGLGVLGKRPDLKYHADSCKETGITEIQKDILKSSAGILKPGGVLVYSTCTLNKEENEDIVNNFLLENKNFEKESFPDKYQEFITDEGYLQTLPFRDDINGFFIAKLRKRGL
jgi:16S rRNA (cytosine967-C5)-methyltransferase